MSAWSQRYGGGSAVAGSGGSRTFSSTGGTGGSGGVYHPTASGGSPAQEDATKAGRFSINPLDPVNSLQENKGPLNTLMEGLKDGLFGTSQPDAEGHHGGLLGSDIPVWGDATRAISEGIANVGGAVGTVATDGLGGALERVPSLSGADSPALKAQFDDNAELQAWLAEPSSEDPTKTNAQAVGVDKADSLFGTGLFSNEDHFKSIAIRKFAEDQQWKHPSLAPGAFTPPGSLADTVSSLFDVFNVGAEVAAKHWAQLDTPGQGGMDRIDLIMAVGDGKVAFNKDEGLLGTGILAGDPTQGLNTIEALVYNKVKSGSWTRDDAANFLASNGQAFGHSAIANIGGSLALDPINIATVGAGTIAKIGATGLRIAKAIESADATLQAAQKALDAAKVAEAAATGKGAIKAAGREVARLTEEVSTAQKTAEGFKAYQSIGEGVRGLNVGARAVEGSEGVQRAFELAGKAYSGLEGTTLGRAAKITRTIIDPLHALDLHSPGASRTVDLLSDSIPKSVADTLGVHHYKGILDDMLRLDHTGGMTQQFVDDFAVAAANTGREGVEDIFRSAQIDGNLGEELMKTLPGDQFENAVKAVKHRDLEAWLRGKTVSKVYQEVWTKADKQLLAKQLEQAYNVRSEAEWVKYFETASKEQMSMLKYAQYGNANRAILDYVAQLTPEAAAKLPVPTGRMVLLAKGTLSRVGAESLLTDLTKLGKSTKKRLKLIREWQEKYPSLRYISIDPANPGRSADAFVQYLEDNLDRYPMQMTAKELEALGEDARPLRDAIGEYGVGFRPEDKYLWGLERENGTGLYRPAGDGWADHVADGAMGYRPAQALRTNILGHPLVDVPVLRAGIRLVDHIDSGARLMKSQVTGAMIGEAARKRFIAKAVTGDLAEHGVTERVAQDWFERITQYTREHQGYSGPRGLGGDELYRAIKEKNLIPQALLNGERQLAPDDIMRLVLEAYDGDIRYIGLTQKLSSRAKTMLFELTGSNFAGQIAEHAWPTLKFRYNPMFQLQEKVEPWVLNAQRGVSFATGVSMSEGDRLTERLLQRMTNNSIVRQADIDQFEYSSQVLFGKASRKIASTPGTRLQKVQAMGKSIGEVQGMKRLNMLRTFRKGLGREVRSAWEQARPGEFDQMLEAAQQRAGRLLNEDDFALQMMSENLYANDIVIERLGEAMKVGGLKADWANAIKPGAWHTPTTLGELQKLDLEHIASSLRLTNKAGEDIKDLKGLRQALATDPDVMDNVVDGLTRLGADPDYIRRVRNGLDFHWNGFWKQAEKRFSLTADESAALQDMMAQAAQLRGMNPVEFMSQVFSPSLIDGTEGTLGHLEGNVRLLREARAAGRKVKPRVAKYAETRSRFAGKEGVSTRDDFVRQLSATFSAHLDPSAKRALLMEFRPELKQAVMDGRSRLDLAELQTMWDDLAENDLADRIIGYMDGKQPTHAFDIIADDARGVKTARASADAYMMKRGVTPLEGRQHFKLDAEAEAFYEQGARHYESLPNAEYEKTGRIPTRAHLDKASTELKPRPDGVDDATWDSYQSFVIDNRNQYDHIVAPKSKGGMGLKITVTRSDPYATSEAMRADIAKGRLKVFGGSSDHPLMTNDQNVMFRAVHDVYGHAAEGFEFGPRGELNAAAKHARMYSNEGRPAMLTETHGQTSYVNYSNDIVSSPAAERVPLNPANPAEDFESRHPFQLPKSQGRGDPDILPGDRYGTIELSGLDQYGVNQRLVYGYTQRVGGGIRSLPPEQQAAILQPISDLLDQFPNLDIHHIEAASFTEPFNTATQFGIDDLIGMGETESRKAAWAVTWGGDSDESVIIFNTDHFDRMGTDWSPVAKYNEHTKQYNTFNQLNPATGKVEDLPRRSAFGAPYNAGGDVAYVARHEAGHAFDTARRPRAWNYKTASFEQKAAHPEFQQYADMMDRFESAAGRLNLSEYGMSSGPEFAAELFSYATDPALIAKNIESPELRDIVEELQQYLRDSGEWVPPADAANAGKTVRELNAAKRGSVYAPQKGALLPQEYLDEFVNRFVGRGKHVESNPDVARAAQMFGKWTDSVITNGLLKGGDSIHAGILHDIAGLPTGAAVPYNFTEGAAVSLATQAMKRKWADAFRLQYFAQERSVLERSVNHPMFGLYPASYMWGKIMPELVRFLALEPFGNKTGGLLRSAMDVQASIALRRETDPYFDAHIEQMGHSQAMSFLGYMLPTLPWEVDAAAPGWMTSIAQQGLANQKAVTNDQTVSDVSLADPAVSTLKKLAPLTTSIPWAGRGIDEVNGQTAEEAQRKQAEEDKLVQAAELEPFMARALRELQEALR